MIATVDALRAQLAAIQVGGRSGRLPVRIAGPGGAYEIVMVRQPAADDPTVWIEIQRADVTASPRRRR